MTENFPPQSNRGKDPSSPQPDGGKVPSQGTLYATSGELISTQQQAGKKSDQSRNPKRDQQRLTRGDSKPKAENLESPSPRQLGAGLRAKATAMAVAISVLPVLAVGTTAHYFASQSFEQIAEAKQADTTEQRRLLSILLIGTGTAAMLTAALAAFWANRTIHIAKTTAAAATARKARKELAERMQLLMQLFTDATEQIRSSLNEEDILKVAVREARRAIAADRVLVYSLDEQSQGRIVAESVADPWPRALGATIDDPCFSASYFEKYQNGRVQAVDDIYSANLTPSDLDQLEPFAVKANLVAPILNQGKLIGLLIAHQCDRPRAWQQSEIDLFAYIAKQTGLVLDNAKLLADSALLQKQVEAEAQRIHFFTDANEQIRSSLNEEDILKTTVREIRLAIAADRVLVYSLDEQSQGKIVAESVTPGWPRALGATIDDPCISARYFEEYQNGRVQAVEDIYSANLTPCQLDQLKPFAVKANLVAPILNQGKLMGLLIAHQCDRPRAWQQSEIDLFAHIAKQAGLVLDNAKLLTDSARLQKQVEFFTNATEYICASLNEEDILQTAVQEVRQAIAADRVLVYSLEEQSQGRIVAESVASRWPRALGATIDDPCISDKYFEKYQNGRVQAVDDIYQANLTPCHLDQLEPFAVKANLVAPILNQGKLLGLLIAHQCDRPRAWQQLEIRWFGFLARQVGLVIYNARLSRQLAQVSQAVLQIPTVADSARRIAAKVEEVEPQILKTSQIVTVGEKTVNLAVDSLATIEATVAESTVKVKHLIESCQKNSQVVSLIKELGVYMKQQAINTTIKAGQAENVAQEEFVSIAETVRFSTEQLSTAIAEIESLTEEIETEAKDLAATMTVSTEQVVKGTKSIEETRQELNQIATLNYRIITLISQIAQAATDQVSNSISVSQSIEKTVNS